MEKLQVKLKWPLVGNKHITDYLEKCIAAKKISGSYIFTGPKDLGKATAAVHFAQSLLCSASHGTALELPCRTCPSCRYFGTDSAGESKPGSGSAHGDCHIIKKENDKKNLPVELIREFIRTLGLSSFLGSYKVGIIRDAEHLSLQAANALLKTLEEPKNKVIIILVVNDIEALPKTILSRSQILQFYPVKTDAIYEYLISEHGASRSEAKNYSRACLGRPALAVKFFEDKEYREAHNNQVNVFLSFFRQDINQRLMSIADLSSPKIIGREAVEAAYGILESWQGVVRDFILAGLNLNNLVQNYSNENEIKDIGPRLSKDKLLSLASVIGQGKDYLSSNVNPKLVLEEVAVSI